MLMRADEVTDLHTVSAGAIHDPTHARAFGSSTKPVHSGHAAARVADEERDGVSMFLREVCSDHAYVGHVV
jgi:hypothetical protein